MNPITTPNIATAKETGATGPENADRARMRLSAVFVARLTLAVAAGLLWLRGDSPVDDRGSESTEKAFMVILAIALGTAVSAAAVAFVATKTALFR